VFDYTAKKLVGINVYDVMILNEINRVNNLDLQQQKAQKCAGYHIQKKGTIYEYDELSIIPGIGEGTKKKIEMNFNIHSVIELSILTDTEVH
jgi:hypothetical protein